MGRRAERRSRRTARRSHARTSATSSVAPDSRASRHSPRSTRSADRCARPLGFRRFHVYGSNDWYWAYGKNSADTVRADAAAHRRIVADGRQPAVRRDRRRLATRSRRGQDRRRHVGPRQRKVRRHGGARGGRSSRRCAARHLDSPAAGAGERARLVALAARSRNARSHRSRRSPEDRSTISRESDGGASS